MDGPHHQRRIPLHDGLLQRSLDEVNRDRRMEREFWARIAAERVARREERLRTGPSRSTRA
jgi:hypothetical protein